MFFRLSYTIISVNTLYWVLLCSKKNVIMGMTKHCVVASSKPKPFSRRIDFIAGDNSCISVSENALYIHQIEKDHLYLALKVLLLVIKLREELNLFHKICNLKHYHYAT